MGSITWGEDVADGYDRTSAAMYDPDVLDPTVDVLANSADGGPALELAVGTGRVALPLSKRGLEVHGIELSPHMLDQLRNEPGADAIAATVGKMLSATTSGEFTLVYWSTSSA